ncbi:MAG: lmo0937 family membrane protein [Bacteroidota bacterium]|nr:lmo0937 family membrane protein [Bacteroidota bacterium]
MRSILYLIAVICIIIWVWQFFFTGGANTSGLIHILLVIAIIAILIAVIRRA